MAVLNLAGDHPLNGVLCIPLSVPEIVKCWMFGIEGFSAQHGVEAHDVGLLAVPHNDFTQDMQHVGQSHGQWRCAHLEFGQDRHGVPLMLIREQFDQQLHLRPEMVEDPRHGQSATQCDLLDTEPIIAALAYDGEGRIENLPPPFARRVFSGSISGGHGSPFRISQ